MAELNPQEKVISRKNEGFPEWLDFDKLREEGIDHLGQLSGKIWTDHNVHDPGITILEVLCYVLLDLGYRTSLPAKDLFAKDPNDNSPDNSFFTPAQILTCNPLTIIDYRKLLIDIPGVKNAWLTVAEDISVDSICKAQEISHDVAGVPVSGNSDCINFLNGLYHVYLEIERDIPRRKELIIQKQNVRTVEDVTEDVKTVLMAHRNLCEDFYDITVLCKQKVGVCADIELHPLADPEKLFLELVNTLREYFSPAPKFYRLQQLLEKGKTIEEIFAGRPFNLMESHGFVDSAELEKIKLRKEIHLSDLYNVIFEIAGVASIKNLSIKNCDGSVCEERLSTPWIFRIFENHVPEFDIDCSGFLFTSSTGTAIIDPRKFRRSLNFEFSNSGKTMMSVPSKDLDVILEPGVYRKDLADYYPIENEFPKVYGIAEGSLSEDVSPQRKAQAMQLKGYLLFFDTLLAGYLSQLKNVRNVLAPSSGKDKATYFVNETANWPGLEKLVSYSLAENTPVEKIMAIPVDREALQHLIDSGGTNKCDWERGIIPYMFRNTAEREVAIHQLIEDLVNGNFDESVFNTSRGCWHFYFYTNAGKIALISPTSFSSHNAAQTALNDLKIVSSDSKNFRRYSESGKTKFSFNIVSSVTGYWQYLQRLTENEKLYLERRNGFLDHLLARFAESFTDYALLSYSDTALMENVIARKEQILSNYPELSSTRGKAYDYLHNGWNNSNVSGLEKRFSAFASVTNAKQENLCHFEVSEFEEQTIVNIAWKGGSILKSERTFESRDEGVSAFQKAVAASTFPDKYAVGYSMMEQKYQVNLITDGITFYYPEKFDSSELAEKASVQLQRMFSPTPLQQDVRASLFEHFPKITGLRNAWRMAEPVLNRDEILAFQGDLLASFSDASRWIADGEDIPRENIDLRKHPDSPVDLVNLKAFDPYVNRADVKNKKTLYRYTISDHQKSFFFISEQEFNSELEAQNNLVTILFILAEPANYEIVKGTADDYLINLATGDTLLARNTVEYPGPEEAREAITMISEFVKGHLYHLEVDSKPVKWRYHLHLGLPAGDEFVFETVDEYGSTDEAIQEGKRIANAAEDIKLSLHGKHELHLKSEKNPDIIFAKARLAGNVSPKEKLDQANALLSLKKKMNSLQGELSTEDTQRYVIADNISKQGNFGYRLVKKNDFQAWYKSAQESGPRDSKRYIQDIFTGYNASHNYLQLCYGGDVTRERKNVRSGVIWYHYLIKPVSHGIPNGFVLFESVQGYRTVQEAQQAFSREHVALMTAGADQASYGSAIVFEEFLIHSTDIVSKSTPLAFIPTETMKFYGHNTQHAAHELSKLAKTYPLRRTTSSEDIFAEYYLCGVNPDKTPEKECADIQEPPLFYFIYQASTDETGFWVSNHYYQTSQEALQQFNFFLMLLGYKGNFHLQRDECDCRWKLYLREILAESKLRYPTAEDAWGKDGVQKFICASQSEDAFSMYRKSEGCCYSFHVACGNLGLIHPCSYDSAEQRDIGMQRLFKASTQIFGRGATTPEGETWEELAIGIDNSMSDLSNKRSACDNLVNLIEKVLRQDGAAGAIAIPGNFPLNSAEPEAREKIKWLARYFPVKKKKAEGSDTYRYFLKIHLPGFCNEDSGEVETCGCNESKKELECCCTAWISECCFDTCEEALQYYYKILKCLGNADNYFPIFNCDCDSYGIRFHCDCEKEVDNIRDATSTGDRGQPRAAHHHCCNEIVAYNPQCYTSPVMVCDAIKRANSLINAEGLHLVEHILLRPHPGADDCNCLIDTCRTPSACNFEWTFPEDDVCKLGMNYCFAPGSDPYSFIATVALPSWPQRFRKKENRKLVEQLLYRETPAHVMLRILWLTPEDLCQFETTYYQWTKWLANKAVCADYHPACRLVDILFHYSFKCFECDDCDPCPPGKEVGDPCNFRMEVISDDVNKYVNAINDLYCWSPICVTRDQVSTSEFDEANLRESEDHEIAPIASAIRTEALIEQRFERYHEKVKEVSEASLENTNAHIARTFLDHPSPEFTDYVRVAEAIAANKRSAENKRVLSTDQKKELIRVVTWYYLDKIVLEEKSIEHDQPVKEFFRKLETKKLLPDLKKWPGVQLTRLMPQVDIREIKKLFKR